jgi:hypothetical protein
MRHRLLQQPSCFEGFAGRVEVRQPDALPLPPPAYLPDRRVRGKVTARTVPAKVHGCERQISKIAHFDDLDGEVGPDGRLRSALGPSQGRLCCIGSGWQWLPVRAHADWRDPAVPG